MVATELKTWGFLTASLLLFLLICGLAALGLFTRPRRWSELAGPMAASSIGLFYPKPRIQALFAQEGCDFQAVAKLGNIKTRSAVLK